MHLKLIVVLGISAAASGCSGDNYKSSPLSSKIPLGILELVPSKSPKVGRLYFSGDGKRPSFITIDGTIYNELCYDDFRRDKSLSTLKKYTFDDGVEIDKAVVTQNLSANVAANVPQVTDLGIKLGGKYDRTYTVIDARKLGFLDEGVETVRAEIGKNCRDTITELKRDGRRVILLLGGFQADKLTDVTDLSAEAKVTVIKDILSGGTSGGRKGTYEYSNILLGVDIEPF